MISSIASLSGIRAAFKMMEASAQNTANANTEGYSKYTVSLSEGDRSGVVVEIGKSSNTGTGSKDAYGNTVKTSNVDYGEEAASQITAKHMLSSNLAALKTEDEMYQSIIDIFA